MNVVVRPNFIIFFILLDKYKVREKIDRVFVQPERIIIAPKIYKGSERSMILRCGLTGPGCDGGRRAVVVDSPPAAVPDVGGRAADGDGDGDVAATTIPARERPIHGTEDGELRIDGGGGDEDGGPAAPLHPGLGHAFHLPGVSFHVDGVRH